ncbi:MAG TPA: hypothetical protein VGL29_11620 [Blastocatellia bacterium]
MSSQCFLALEVSQLRKLTGRELQKFFNLVINIGSLRRGGQFLPSQQLRDIGLGNFGGNRQFFLLNPQFFQPPLDY